MIPVEHAHLNIAAATHPGVRGKPNEDRYSVSAYHLSAVDQTPSVLALIADGIGGHRGGEVAADLALKVISKYVMDVSSDQPAQVLAKALIHASQVILNHAISDPLLTGMGTTCVCAWVIGDQLYAVSVGDSRLYLGRGARLYRLTTDHTWIQDALTQGILTPEQAKGHPNSHIIHRFLGSGNSISPDLRLRLNPAETDDQSRANQGMRLLPRDRLLLCSDGLTDLVKDAEILEVLQTSQFAQSPTHLIDLANQRGGHDNITIVAMEVPPTAEITRPLHLKSKFSSTRNGSRSAASWIMIILLLLAILILVMLLIFTFVH